MLPRWELARSLMLVHARARLGVLAGSSSLTAFAMAGCTSLEYQPGLCFLLLPAVRLFLVTFCPCLRFSRLLLWSFGITVTGEPMVSANPTLRLNGLSTACETTDKRTLESSPGNTRKRVHEYQTAKRP